MDEYILIPGLVTAQDGSSRGSTSGVTAVPPDVGNGYALPSRGFLFNGAGLRGWPQRLWSCPARPKTARTFEYETFLWPELAHGYGCAARCEEAAMPFRYELLQILGLRPGWGHSPEFKQAPYGGAEPTPHIGRQSRGVDELFLVSTLGREELPSHIPREAIAWLSPFDHQRQTPAL